MSRRAQVQELARCLMLRHGYEYNPATRTVRAPWGSAVGGVHSCALGAAEALIPIIRSDAYYQALEHIRTPE